MLWRAFEWLSPCENVKANNGDKRVTFQCSGELLSGCLPDIFEAVRNIFPRVSMLWRAFEWLSRGEPIH
jgi:hypothetical protein